MNEILQEIKSVQGVTGVLVLNKNEGVTYQVTPVSFPKEGLQEIGTRLSRLSKTSSTGTSLELRFENGMAFFFNLDKGSVLIFGRPGMNLSVLNLVLKSAFLSIERKLSKEGEKPSFKGEERGSFILDKIYLEHLVTVLNQIAKVYKEKLGTYSVTQNLRKSKEEFLIKFDLLQNFFVDNNGIVSLIRGKEEESSSDILKAFALWISHFIHLCSVQEPEILTDIKLLTSGLEDKLGMMGFYETYEKLKNT
jgi:hypothetical protein